MGSPAVFNMQDMLGDTSSTTNTNNNNSEEPTIDYCEDFNSNDNTHSTNKSNNGESDDDSLGSSVFGVEVDDTPTPTTTQKVCFLWYCWLLALLVAVLSSFVNEGVFCR